MSLFQTITADNGSEFYGLSDQLSSLGSKAYFCHPYSSWEKGANEKHNSLIRRFLPKGTSFADFTPESVARIQNGVTIILGRFLGILHHYKLSTRKDLLLLDFSPARWGGASAIAI